MAAFERMLGNGDRSSMARTSRSRVAPNVAWSMDFVSDQTASGQRFRALTVVDVFSRECLAIDGADVVNVLSRIAAEHSSPKRLYCDNDSEFSSRLVDLGAYANKVVMEFSRPGKPTDNAFIESFNDTLRDECLNVHWFDDLTDAKIKLQAGNGSTTRVGLTDHSTRFRRCSTRPDGPSKGQKLADIVDQESEMA
jgi:putative transposase